MYRSTAVYTRLPVGHITSMYVCTYEYIRKSMIRAIKKFGNHIKAQWATFQTKSMVKRASLASSRRRMICTADGMAEWPNGLIHMLAAAAAAAFVVIRSCILYPVPCTDGRARSACNIREIIYTCKVHNTRVPDIYLVCTYR